MAAEAQIEANRLNAIHSTGPRTEEGKARSRFNGLKHGARSSMPVLPDESEDKWIAFHDDYVAAIAPKLPYWNEALSASIESAKVA